MHCHECGLASGWIGKSTIHARRGVKKKGGKVLLKAHVEQILFAGGRAAGVRLRDGSTIRASTAVISNATAW